MGGGAIPRPHVLVVDDTHANVVAMHAILDKLDVVIVEAASGEEAPERAAERTYALALIDVQMPRMDGFTFLRLLMASRPTPVLVVSSHSAKENVFRALELGAIDFIAKPETFLTAHTQSVREQLERMVAVKRIHVQVGNSERGAQFAIEEAKRLARLQHPNIVTVFDVLDDNGDLLMVMEYLSGYTLEDLKSPLTIEDFLNVARQSLSGLAAAHALAMIYKRKKC